MGVLTVPALGLELPVLDEWGEAVSRQAPCRHSGSAYRGDLILFTCTYDGQSRLTLRCVAEEAR